MKESSVGQARKAKKCDTIRNMKKQTNANARYPLGIREEELKNKIAADWFGAFDCSRIIGNIDFCVDIPATELALGYDAEPMLWAEAKAGNKKDIIASFVQLILTIGGEHTADKHLPPHFLGAFDAEKIAFLPYHEVMAIFDKSDFDWTVTPSDHESKEFKELYGLAKDVIERRKLMFRYDDDEKELRRFIKANFKSGRRDISKILINKNNFTHIYRQWREQVMPFVSAPWDVLKKKYAIYDRDFFLAEMNIDDNGTPDIGDDSVANDFYITFDAKSSTPYTVKRKNEDDLFTSLSFGFKTDGLDAYAAFWRRYKRPPKKEYWDFIVKRIDLLVPQDVRERKGSFFTPKKWVELSQHYLEMALGENWQDEYYIWDCCAGTGNLLAGLTNKYNIWASTIDQPDVDVMMQQAKNGYNLLESHIFRFDFLNDPFDKLPQGLQGIINDPEKRKKLVIYINPPYKEATSIRQKTGTGDNIAGLTKGTQIYEKYLRKIGVAARELFALFLMRIHDEIPGCIVGQFSKLKHLQSPNFKSFRRAFHGTLEKSFMAPADTFDNVKGKFPIGFFVWRLGVGEGIFASTVADVYDATGHYISTKSINSYAGDRFVIEWLRQFYDKKGNRVGYLVMVGTDVQHSNNVFVTSKPSSNDFKKHTYTVITEKNLVQMSIYMTIRHVIEQTWLNDRDQFLWPNDGWAADMEFQSDCLAWALFDNVIKSADGVNHWIPFTEAEVEAKDCFASHFMSDFLKGREFSAAAQAVMDAGRELWRYYHAQPNANPNASYYDIRLHFQGSTTDAKGKVRMNSDSSDARYTELLATLRTAMKHLARRIEPKVYEYGFLKR